MSGRKFCNGKISHDKEAAVLEASQKNAHKNALLLPGFGQRFVG